LEGGLKFPAVFTFQIIPRKVLNHGAFPCTSTFNFTHRLHRTWFSSKVHTNNTLLLISFIKNNPHEEHFVLLHTMFLTNVTT